MQEIVSFVLERTRYAHLNALHLSTYLHCTHYILIFGLVIMERGIGLQSQLDDALLILKQGGTAVL